MTTKELFAHWRKLLAQMGLGVLHRGARRPTIDPNTIDRRAVTGKDRYPVMSTR